MESILHCKTTPGCVEFYHVTDEKGQVFTLDLTGRPIVVDGYRVLNKLSKRPEFVKSEPVVVAVPEAIPAAPEPEPVKAPEPEPVVASEPVAEPVVEATQQASGGEPEPAVTGGRRGKR